jgi:hypothetical protein
MGKDDFATLAELEEAFERKDLHRFISLLNRSKGLPLLLRVHAVCMLEHIGDESVVQALCRILMEDPVHLRAMRPRSHWVNWAIDLLYLRWYVQCWGMQAQSFGMSLLWH